MIKQSPLTSEMLVSAIKHHLPQRTVVKVEDRGVWIRHNFRVTLDGGEIVQLKVDRSLPASEKEAYICQLLSANGLPAPQVLAVDSTGALLPAPFIIQQHVGGGRLGDLLERASAPDELEIYRALGRFYKRLHSVQHAHSGWIRGAGEVLPFSPAERQYDEVILKIGQEAVQRGLLSARSHERLGRIWSDSLPWLDAHQPALVAGAFPWATYLIKVGDWQVSKIMDLHDALYWDAAWDLAMLKYPPFRVAPSLKQWWAFVAEYGAEPDERRLKVYLLLQRLEAALGNYLEPAVPGRERWKQHVWQTFDSLLAQVERL